MAQLATGRYLDQLRADADGLAATAGTAGPGTPVPSCPGWDLRKLAAHVGRAHRWAAAIVAARSAEFIEFRAVPDGRLPDDPAARPAWLRAGAALVAQAVSGAGADEVWAFGQQRPAAFWARRMTHETAVHHADAVLALGGRPQLPPDIAADGIDEWLTVMSGPLAGPLFGRPDPRLAALASGTSLRLLAAGADLAGGGDWIIAHSGGAVTVSPGPGPADATVSGPAADLLLVLVRRLPPAAVTVQGDPAVLDRWLAGTSF